MPAKKKGRKGKAKKVKIVPDPDAPYKEQLHGEYYLPKFFAQRKNDDLISAIEDAIDSALVGDSNYFSTDNKDLNRIPMSQVPFICSTLGLCPSAEQCELMKTMVTPDPVVPKEGDDLQNFDGMLTSDSPIEMASKEKLVRLLLDLLRTRVLSYDAQVLANPNPAFPVRVLSVMYTPEESIIRKCFDALWPACGSQYTLTKQKEKIRCLGVSEVRELAAHQSTTEPPFTEEELQHMVLAFEDVGEDLIREDNFLLVMQDVL